MGSLKDWKINSALEGAEVNGRILSIGLGMI
jgi:hypothetical protein